MRGRSSGESTRPSSSSEDDWAKTPIATRRCQTTNHTPRVSKVATQTSTSPTPYQFVCPDPLIRRTKLKPSTPRTHIADANANADDDTPTFSRPRPPVRRSTPQSGSYRKPVPLLDSSPCSTTIEIASTDPEGLRMSIPIDESSSQSLDELFDEVMNACLTDGVDIEDDQVPLMNGHIGWGPALSSMPSAIGPVTPGYRGRVPLKTDSPAPRKARTISVDEPKRFIPSGRSFEPLRKTNTGPLRIPSIKPNSPLKEISKVVNVGSKVKDAIAKFELKSVCPHPVVCMS